MHRDYDKNTSNEGSPYTLLNFYTVDIIVCQFCIFDTKNFCEKNRFPIRRTFWNMCLQMTQQEEDEEDEEEEK